MIIKRTVQMNDDMYEELRHIADLEQLSIAAVIRIAIKDHIKNYKRNNILDKE